MGNRFSKTLNVYRARFITSMKMFIRYPMNFIMTFFEPIIWLSPFYFMGKSFSIGGKVAGFEQYTGNSDFMGFLVIGYIISCYVSAAFWSMGFSIKEEMRQGVLESNWTTPVNRRTLLLSKSVFYFVNATIEILITSFVCYFCFGFSINGNFLKALAFIIPGIIGLLGIGMALASLVLVAKNANPIIDLSNSIIQGFSGSFFPVKVMSKGFMFISLGIPLTYVYDSVRAILLNQEPLFELQKEFVILLIAASIFCVVGNLIFNKIERKCRDMGVLSGH